MEYFEKIEKAPTNDLAWNIPEQKQGSINIIGGNSQSFRTEIKIAEFLSEKYPLRDVNLILPDSLKNQLPPLPNFQFLPSTDSGSFDESQELIDAFNTANFNLVLGDFSKNAITSKAVASAYQSSDAKGSKMSLITRDAVDIISDNKAERILMNENFILLTSMLQLQKLLKSIYYPKMLLLSQSLIQVAEVLHKFTLSYPVRIITLHNEQILIAENGLVKAISLNKAGYSPLTIWQGEFAAKITALNLYNPNSFIDAVITAIFS